MDKSVLILTDSLAANWSRLARRRSQDWRYHVLPLGIGSARYLIRNAGRLRGIHHVAVSAELYASAAEQRLKEFVPEFYYSSPRQRTNGTNLLELLAIEPGVNAWWLADACEKSPLRGPFIRRLYWLALIKEVLDSKPFDEVWIDLQDQALARVISTRLRDSNRVWRSLRIGRPRLGRSSIVPGTARLLAWQTYVVGKSLLQLLMLWGQKGERQDGQSTNPRRIALFTRFPALWRDPYGEKREERYFAQVDSALREQADVEYVALLSGNPFQLWRERAALRRIVEQGKIRPVALHYSVRTLLQALVSTTMLRRYLRYQWSYAPHNQVNFAGWNIAELWDAEIRTALTGHELIQNLLLLQPLRELVRKRCIAVILHPLEFQPMERALWTAVRGQATSIGIQHSTFCRNHFMYVFRRNELAEYLKPETPQPSPLPDYYAVAGSWAFELMRENGALEDRIGLCGAIRYNDLRLEQNLGSSREQARQRLGIPPQESVVLILTSQFRDESLDLLDNLGLALVGFQNSGLFLLKSHYHCRLDSQARTVFETAQVNYRILDADLSLHDYIRAADIVVVGATTASVEALALGRSPVIYTTPTLPVLSALADSPGVAVFVSTPEQLRAALIARLDSSSAGFEAGVREHAIARLFHKLDGRAADRLIEFMRENQLIASATARTNGNAAEHGRVVADSTQG